MKPDYTLGLFANLYPRYEGDSRGIFVKRMVDSLEAKNVKVIKAIKKVLLLLHILLFIWILL